MNHHWPVTVWYRNSNC